MAPVRGILYISQYGESEDIQEVEANYSPKLVIVTTSGYRRTYRRPTPGNTETTSWGTVVGLSRADVLNRLLENEIKKLQRLEAEIDPTRERVARLQPAYNHVKKAIGGANKVAGEVTLVFRFTPALDITDAQFGQIHTVIKNLGMKSTTMTAEVTK